MRIIAGKHKGRKLNSPRGKKIRPTSDRLKESLFSSLGNLLIEALVLDLFAGTGNLGLEALSRGAQKVLFVDNHYKSIKVIRENIRLLGEEERTQVTKVSYEKVKQALPEEEGWIFDLLFIDPPYQMYKRPDFYDKIQKLWEELPLSDDSLLIFEHPWPLEFPWREFLWKNRSCGDSGWSIFLGKKPKINKVDKK